MLEDRHHATVTPILTQVLAAARSNARATGGDQFASTKPLQGEGSSVTIRMKPIVLYRDGKLEMIVYADPEYLNKGDFSGGIEHETENYPMIEFATRNKSTGHYMGANAFGTEADVSVFHGETDNLLIVNRGHDSSYLYHAVLDGPAAKTLVDATEFVVEAVLTTAGNGKLAACEDKVHSATLDTPVDHFTSSCWVAARVTRLAYVNKTTGEGLRVWDENSPEASMMEDLPH